MCTCNLPPCPRCGNPQPHDTGRVYYDARAGRYVRVYECPLCGEFDGDTMHRVAGPGNEDARAEEARR